MKAFKVIFSTVFFVLFLFAVDARAARDIPLEDDLLFGALTETFPDSGETGPWECFMPEGQFLEPMNTPTVGNSS